jgi:hypothetical protein
LGTAWGSFFLDELDGHVFGLFWRIILAPGVGNKHTENGQSWDLADPK